MFQVHARNFRGFAELDFSLSKVNFLTGGNSSGKTSIIYLMSILLSSSFRNDFDVFGTKYISHFDDIASPYGAERDVITIGYDHISDSIDDNESPDDRDGIFADFQAGTKKSLALKKLSVLAGRQSVHVVARGGKLFRKRRRYKDVSDPSSFFRDEHFKGNTGYSRISQGVSKESTSLDEHSWFLATLFSDRESRKVNAPFLRTSPVYVSRFYGPIRKEPLHYYYDVDEGFDSAGSHIPKILEKMISDSQKEGNRRIVDTIHAFGRKSGLFDSIYVHKIDRRDSRSPYKIYVEKSGRDFPLDAVGYGVSQILPLIVDSISSVSRHSDNRLIAIQQPEVHLHPQAQAEFGELIFDLASSGVNFIIETHSDYIIDRFRICQNKSQNKVSSKILYTENSSSGNHLHEISISDDGGIENAPPNYRDFFMKEQLNIFGIL